MGRPERLQRLVKLQAERRAVAEWQVAKLRRTEANLIAAQTALLEALGDASALHGLFAAPMGRRLRGLSAEQSDAALERARAERVVEGLARAEKQAERLAAVAVRQAAQAADRQALDDIVERLVQSAARLP